MRAAQEDGARDGKRLSGAQPGNAAASHGNNLQEPLPARSGAHAARVTLITQPNDWQAAVYRVLGCGQ
jgi:hypothetical protein